MKILAIGGSGSVGTKTLPFMTARYDITVFDLVPPRVALPFIKGDVRDENALFEAYAGCVSLIYMATGPAALNPETAAAQFDVNVTGLHLALRAAHRAGISHAVVTSTMSVYDRLFEHRDIDDEALAPDATQHYGLSKRLGEEVCRAACQQWHMSISALRLCNVVNLDDLGNFSHPFIATAASDVANALDLALQRRLAGFEAFTINGDWEEPHLKLTKARTLLGWQPLARPRAAGCAASDAAGRTALP
jgi:nucleoside-diphosphate-sugar epimerase